MRNIAEIIEDDRNGKQLSQTERQIAVAYIQGKYDAVMELKISNNSNTMEVLDKIRAEANKECISDGLGRYIRFDVLDRIINKYKAESEGKNEQIRGNK